MRKIFPKDPVSGLSHGLGAILSLVGSAVLLGVAWGKPWHLTTFAVYGATLFLVYLASSLYHSLRVSPRWEGRLLGLDRAAIFCLIAGTYTPICLVALGGGWGWSLFGIVWGLAALGIAIDVVSRRRMPDWLTALFYLVMGWLALVAIGPLLRALPLSALLLLLAGCLIYTVGAVVCVLDRPRLKPGVFGAHELWHVLVLVASACHFVLMLRFIAPL
jgi:hemolysin III